MNNKRIDGILNIDKPPNVTSMDVVRIVKRLTGAKKVGHAGTLDPLATGVLPVCLGQATRLMDHMVSGRKIYRGNVTLGIATDSYDSDGAIVSTQDSSQITELMFESTLLGFLGETNQEPPMFSALKHQGKRLYELAREGVEIEREPRRVRVFRLITLGWAPPVATIEVECGRGFYMRTLAHEIGQSLGCGAHLSSLRRTKGGAFEITSSITLSSLETEISSGKWRDLLFPPDAGAKDLLSITIDCRSEKLLRTGQPIHAKIADMETEHAEARRVYSTDGRFIAIARYDRPLSQWKPIKVFDLPFPSKLSPKAEV